MHNTREKTEYIKKTSYPIWIITTLSFIAGIVFIGIVKPFPYWWLLIIPVAIQVISTLAYLTIMTIKVDLYSNNVEKSTSVYLMVLPITQLLSLNLINFAYGILFFNKLHSTFKKSF